VAISFSRTLVHGVTFIGDDTKKNKNTKLLYLSWITSLSYVNCDFYTVSDISFCHSFVSLSPLAFVSGLVYVSDYEVIRTYEYVRFLRQWVSYNRLHRRCVTIDKSDKNQI
jgi:hypothetical protein